jgi:ribose 5-phosphate isomerase B
MKNITTIGIAADHAGYEIKEFLKDYLSKKGIEMHDFGTFSDESADYPDFAHPLAECIEKGKAPIGISICGSGNGITMTVNKHQKIRAALCWNTEIAELAVQHNNANICSLPARYISESEAINIIDAFLNSEFEGGRHQRRIDKIPV